jgi:hypothetical protein
MVQIINYTLCPDPKNKCYSKVSLSEDFMSLFLTHPDFENSAEEFYSQASLSGEFYFVVSKTAMSYRMK